MSINMSEEIRTAMINILRDHPNILDHVTTKSEVNNLTGDRLVELADYLEIDFMARLHSDDNLDSTSLVNFGENLEDDFPFLGELISDLQLSALGVSQTLKIRFHYGYTPEWQFACLEDKRLKYRTGQGSIGYNVEVFDESRFEGDLDFEKPEKIPREWLSNEDMFIWPLINGPIVQKVNDEIKTISQKEDKMNREQLGFPPLEKYE